MEDVRDDEPLLDDAEQNLCSHAEENPLTETPVFLEADLGRLFEDILERLGGFGRYQKCIIFLVVLPMFFASAFMQSSWLFVSAMPTDHWCHIPLHNLTFAEERQLLPLEKNDDDTVKHSTCKMYDLNYTDILEKEGSIEGVIRYINTSHTHLNTTHCRHGWTFDRHNSDTSLITEFLLVCGAAFLPTLAYILTSTGGVLGIPLGGYFSDHYGRKRSFFVFLLLYVLLGVGSCFAPNFIAFVVIACVQNIFTNPCYILPYMVGIEILTPGIRSTFSVLLTVAFTLGGVAFTAVAYFIRHWRYLIFASTAPFFLFLGYWFVMPESPRWLLSIGQFSETEKFLRKVAKANGKIYDEECEAKYSELQELYAEKKRLSSGMNPKKTSWLDLLKYPNLRKKTLVLTYLSCAVNVIYTGLNYYAPALGENPYLSFLLVGLVELPGSLFTQLIADRLGRRLTMIVCFVAGTASCIATVAIPSQGSSTWPILLTLFLVAKLFVTSAYTVQELMVYELFPTVLRGEGVALTNIVGYFVSNFGPVIVYLRFNGAAFPMIVFGCLSAIGIFATMILPETLNCPLPETIPEAENFGKLTNVRDVFRIGRRSPNVPATQDLSKRWLPVLTLVSIVLILRPTSDVELPCPAIRSLEK
ncbi:beta-alanine transporter-like [Paramacrobiotus metropolitanus]|uniref:beta-alanine transporter-like n=1 Tax=Paramacrobiotus metropolitanus TaxID=2943436 RepID=UPI002445B2AF|nr:beta-alanine transporter-like [Paramacrobiotus metropolitanus]